MDASRFLKPGEETANLERGVKNRWHWGWIEELGENRLQVTGEGTHRTLSMNDRVRDKIIVIIIVVNVLQPGTPPVHAEAILSI